MPSLHDFIPLAELALVIGRAVSPAEIAELTLLGDVVEVDAARYVKRAAISRIRNSVSTVRAHTRYYRPGRHKTLQGIIHINQHTRHKS